MILQLLNGDLLYPPEKVSSVDDAKIWLATTDLFPNSPHHIVVTRIDTPEDDEDKYLVMYAQPSIHIPDLFTFPESPYNSSNSSWMADCVNESILTYLAAEERYQSGFMAYPGIWRNSHPVIVERVVELLPQLQPKCHDLIWSNVWANSNSEVVDILITCYQDMMCSRTVIQNTNPKMVDWCMQHLFEEEDMPWHLMYTRVTSLLPNATTPETVRDLWAKWKKIPPATFRWLPFNGHSQEYLTLFRRDMTECELYNYVQYESLTDEDLAIECVHAQQSRQGGSKLWLRCANSPCERVMSYLLDNVYKAVIASLTLDQLARNPTDRAVDCVLARMVEKPSEYNTDRVVSLLRYNKNPRAVQFCQQKMTNDGRDLFEIVHTVGEKHYGCGCVALEHTTPALVTWLCTQPSFIDRVNALEEIEKKKWMWQILAALSTSTDCCIYFV